MYLNKQLNLITSNEIELWLIEGFLGTLKCEMYYLQKFYTYEELRQAIDEYIVFYNTKRLQKNLNGLTPIEYRNQTLVS